MVIVAAFIGCLTIIIRFLISEEFNLWRQRVRDEREREETKKREKKLREEQERLRERERKMLEKREKEATLLRAKLAKLQGGFELTSKAATAPLAEKEADV